VWANQLFSLAHFFSVYLSGLFNECYMSAITSLRESREEFEGMSLYSVAS